MKARAVLLVWAVLVALVGGGLAVVQPGDLGGDDDEHPDVALTDTVILKFADLPVDQGWRERPVDEDVDLEAEPTTSPPPECEGQAAALFGADDDALPGETAGAESPTFERGDLGADATDPPVVVNAFVAAFGDTAGAEQPFALYRDPSAGQCLIATVETSFNDGTTGGQGGPQVTLTNPTVENLPAPAIGEDSLLLRLSGAFGVPTVIELPFRYDLHLVRVGRIVVGLVVFSLNTPPPDDLAPALLHAMASRVP